MDQSSRIGPADARIVLFNKGGRDFRLDRLMRGEEVPREFFYGFLDLKDAGYSAAMMATSGAVSGVKGRIADVVERQFASLTRFGVRPLSMRVVAPWFADARVAISYTDGFSLSMGLGFPRGGSGPALIGGFHGLSDIEHRAPKPMRAFVRELIKRALAGLDHAFFFGPADRGFAIERYDMAPERSSIFPFGIDTEFWRPMKDVPRNDFVVAIGQDRNRDYDLLAAAPGRHPTRIVTRQHVTVPAGADHVRTTVGDFFGANSMTDENIRTLYNTAAAVVVPLKDVFQPSGYSVTLQALSCGRPVILSKNRGLWAPDLLRDGENCLLVPPGDAAALGAAIARIRSDDALAQRLGRAGRETALRHFSLKTMGEATKRLAELGMSITADKAKRFAA